MLLHSSVYLLAAHIDPLRWAIGGPSQPVEEPDGRAAGTQRRTVINPGLARLLNFSLVLPLCGFAATTALRRWSTRTWGGTVPVRACAVHGIRMALARATSTSSRRASQASLHTPSRQDAIPEFISIPVASGFRGAVDEGKEGGGGGQRLPFFCR